MQDFRWLKDLWQGKKVLGPVALTGTKADPQGTTANLFTISVGTILLTGLLGIRLTSEGGVACNMKFQWQTTDLCAVASINAATVGNFYTITGNVNDAMQIGASGIPIWMGPRVGLLATGNGGAGLLMGPGTIVVNCTGAPTGTCRYIACWVPLDPGATLVAV